MRKQIAVGVGLLSVMLAIGGPPVVTLSLRSCESPLRVGMTEDEANQLMGGADKWWILYADDLNRAYPLEPDWRGRKRIVGVYMDFDTKRITNVRVIELDAERTRPPWLDKALKMVGW